MDTSWIGEWVVSLMLVTVGVLVAVFVAVTQLRRALSLATDEARRFRVILEMLEYTYRMANWDIESGQVLTRTQYRPRPAATTLRQRQTSSSSSSKADTPSPVTV